MGLKRINFINPCDDAEAYSLLVTCTYSGFKYYQTSDMLRDIGYKISEEEYYAFNNLQRVFLDNDPSMMPDDDEDGDPKPLDFN